MLKEFDEYSVLDRSMIMERRNEEKKMRPMFL